MDVREFALQEDTGYRNGRNMTEVKGPQSHRKAVDNCIQIEQFLPHRRYIQKFCDLLVKYGLLGDYVMRYSRGNNELSLKDFFQQTHPELWTILGISWEYKVYDYLYFTIEWEGICANEKK